VRPRPNDSEGKGFVEHGLQLRLEHLEQKVNKSQGGDPATALDLRYFGYVFGRGPFPSTRLQA
jgi:hypothetical protein